MTATPDFDLESIVGGEPGIFSQTPGSPSAAPRYPISSLETPTSTSSSSIFPNLTRKYASAPTPTSSMTESDRLLNLASSPITVTPQQIMEAQSSSRASSRAGSPSRRVGSRLSSRSPTRVSSTRASSPEMDRFIDFISTPPKSTTLAASRSSSLPRSFETPPNTILFKDGRFVPYSPPHEPSRVRTSSVRPSASSSVRRQLFPTTTSSRQKEIDRFRASLMKTREETSTVHRDDELDSCASCVVAKNHIMSKYGHNMPEEMPESLISSRRPLGTRARSPTRRTLTSAVMIPGTSSLPIGKGDRGTLTLKSIYTGEIVEYKGDIGERYTKNDKHSYFINDKPVTRSEFIAHGGWVV